LVHYQNKWLRNADAWLAYCQTLFRIFFVLLGIAGAALAVAIVVIIGWLPTEIGVFAIDLVLAALFTAYLFCALGFVEGIVRIWLGRRASQMGTSMGSAGLSQKKRRKN
jgi:hypothetical protein